jgi:CBS domain-containing protein
LKVKLLVDSHYPTVSPDDPLTKARAIMRDIGLRMLPIVEEGTLYGIIKRENVLLLTSTRSTAAVRDAADRPRLIFRPDDDILRSIKAMIELDEWYSPVVDERNGKYMGIVSLTSFLRFMLRKGMLSADMKVEEIMTSSSIEYVLPDEPIYKVWRKMVELQISGFPVVRSAKTLELIGMITQHDLLRRGYTRIELESPSGPRKGPRVREAMVTPAISVSPEDSVEEVIKILLEKDIGRVPVTNKKGSLVGIVDRSDAVRAFLR